MKDLQGFYVLFLQLSCKSEIMSKCNVKRKKLLTESFSG